MSNWKICLHIDSDGDFWYARSSGFEHLSDDECAYLDATPENVERTIEQLGLAACTVDTRESLKDDVEPALAELFTDAANCFQRELRYHSVTDNWIDFSIDADFGNQSVRIGLVGESNIDYGWRTWGAAFEILYTRDVPYRNELELFDDLLTMIENGEAGDFDASAYAPDDIDGWSSLVLVVDMLPEYDANGSRIG